MPILAWMFWLFAQQLSPAVRVGKSFGWSRHLATATAAATSNATGLQPPRQIDLEFSTPPNQQNHSRAYTRHSQSTRLNRRLTHCTRIPDPFFSVNRRHGCRQTDKKIRDGT
jgi:hypothetical protein